MIQLLIILIIIGLLFNQYTKEYSLEKMDYRREIRDSILEIDEPFYIHSIVENRKWLPLSFLQVKEKYPKHFDFVHKNNVQDIGLAKVHTMTLSLLPYQRITRSYQLVAHKRGRHFLQEAILISGDFIGLQTVNRIFDQQSQEVVVLPKAVELNQELEPYGNYYGDISVNRWIIEDPIINRGLREYTGNEPEKHIHWASSLKTGELLVKNFDYTTDHSAVLVLNTAMSKYSWGKKDPDKIEKCFSLSRSILEDFEGTGIPYGLASNVGTIHQYFGKTLTDIGYGPGHLRGLLESLGRAEYYSRSSFGDLLRKLRESQDQSRTYVLVTPGIIEEDLSGLEELRKVAGKVVLITLNEDHLSEISTKIETYRVSMED
ncbi:DUF58 domain-containing protein [Isachenkonia alkalipeptolytica]|uniref:DUF58 domain-containing protein n=1 Tax=Isachenkonia alkalipeptolytica TaxID=2565777 RepID=A0AA44BDL2_9CLOT|nr:DUF58 domain-containing protein [Isachenkonia alkalipeptolytica]NBG88033.1 DUF58 domain-containing protein [Isachenkonia alkalipeptolytica]